MAAAIGAHEAGHQVSVFESARTVGGRARTVPSASKSGESLVLDNGQHILIGAYAECLRLMRVVGVDPDTALLRTPLALVFPDGGGLQLPDSAPPFDALVGIARARGWSAREKFELLARAAKWRLQNFECRASASVADICAGLPARLMDEFIDPLCVSALNTLAVDSSAQVFLRVLRDSLFSGRGGSNLLLPRVDLGALFPQAASDWLEARGHSVRTGRRVQALARSGASWWVDGDAYDAVLLATPSIESARLVSGAATVDEPLMREWAAQAQSLQFASIATVYLRVQRGVGNAPSALLAHPMTALRSRGNRPAQFVFDRERLYGDAGVLAFVVSAFDGERETLVRQVIEQAAEQLALHDVEHIQTVVEKRATFACTPGLQRPAMQIAPGLLACGDYVTGPYPATLEGAVLNGTAAATALTR
ncbi:hydroxysqualene dehydroxylase HpnE [Diaphorobacter aerolatus]|uniref:FAD-dependent oxidoreductase n=1 Tax=Diaphorobacter aerolatus TaxID=1288495 RepID=A0A7H0GQQ1_9BURK|nr:hydroxysqualene dehydroxylase HpnE [Diaphorobacter aerolatus]QNP50617.1 FAD-dependent oxidoreductase [Diaphorobacter aerolatus]